MTVKENIENSLQYSYIVWANNVNIECMCLYVRASARAKENNYCKYRLTYLHFKGEYCTYSDISTW